MPWQEASIMSLRVEFVMLASQPGANKRELCRRFGISPKTGYKWLKRHGAAGEAGLADASRRPVHSPFHTASQLEHAILELRDAHPAWGARKLRKVLENEGELALPSPSTIQAILLRNGRISPEESAKHEPFTRFEHERPNALWQMDFKGHFAMGQGRCHPLTVLDDHSRFNVCLRACANEQTATVQAALTDTFRRYGMPERIGVDNGAPWGDSAEHRYTVLCVWLIRLEVRVSHSRPYHPQTLGKDERFHGTLNRELISRRTFADLQQAQAAFDPWRECYNLKRPHESLSMQTPVTRYKPSPRSFPEQLPAVHYPSGEIVRKVQANGEVCYQGRVLKVSKAFRGQPVALRPSTTQDGLIEVFFCHQKVAKWDLTIPA
jgi:transposase InsO family protein